MKTKIKIKDFSGKESEIAATIRDIDHLEAQKRYKKIVFKNKKVYCRKQKHRKNYIE